MSETEATTEKAARPSVDKKSVNALAKAMYRARQNNDGEGEAWSDAKKGDVKMARKALRRLSAKGFELVKKDA